MTNDDNSSSGRVPGAETAIELSLVGLHPDGEHIILRTAGNTKFVLPITESLQAAIRGDRSRLEFLQSSAALSPREIQGRVRAGETAEHIAASAGMPLAQVQRYERTVLDERAFVARQARAARLGNTADAPALGDLVTDRLAARNVETSELAWDAIKLATGGWQVSVNFEAGGSERTARWRFHPRTQVLQALEDEARWLSETEIADEPIPRRHLSSVRDAQPAESEVAPVYSLETGAQQVVVDTDALLDDLAARRGVRQGFDADAEPSSISSGSSALSQSDGGQVPGDEASVARIVDFQQGGGSVTEQIAGAASPLSSTSLPSDPPGDPRVSDAEHSCDEPSGDEHGGDERGSDRRGGAGLGALRTGEDGASQPEFDLGAIDEPRVASANASRVGSGSASGPSAEAVPPATQGSATSEASVKNEPTGKPKQGRRGRSQMPTWDEIVFGAKTD
ncbi:septation protein SepH [Rarobacter faecitabidus]|uniref:DUF3071 family protein n=1 Tax=Rarobacter faecitabidus TaxID=13243 RepID=A0A542ZW41_RARFA|nr:septation protein SepH [Rarobacter faecitabidus]TQL64551.1 DUF3071 family protein [Rarobacter faecitabidus]